MVYVDVAVGAVPREHGLPVDDGLISIGVAIDASVHDARDAGPDWRRRVGQELGVQCTCLRRR